MSESPDDVLVAVQLLGLPLRLLNRSTQYTDELFREFRLILAGGEDGHEVPKKLLSLINEANLTYGKYLASQRQELTQAIERGDEFVDLTYQVPRAAGTAAKHLDEVFEAADVYCRRGELLTLAAATEVADFRSWYLGEFSRQLTGGAPRSWKEACSISNE